MNRGDIKDILLVIVIAGIAIGISAGAEHIFYKYLYNDNNTVEESVSNSFCYSTLGKDMQPALKCRWDTPELLMRLYGFKPKRMV